MSNKRTYILRSPLFPLGGGSMSVFMIRSDSDRDEILSELNSQPSSIMHINRSFKSDPIIAMTAVKSYGGNFTQINDSFKDDFEFMLENYIEFKCSSERLKNNEYFISRALKKYRDNDPDVFHEESNKGMILDYIHDDILNYIRSLEGKDLDEKIDSFILINDTKHKVKRAR